MRGRTVFLYLVHKYNRPLHLIPSAILQKQSRSAGQAQSISSRPAVELKRFILYSTSCAWLTLQLLAGKAKKMLTTSYWVALQEKPGDHQPHHRQPGVLPFHAVCAAWNVLRICA